MVRVVILGQGYVASIFASGLEKIKAGKMEPTGSRWQMSSRLR